MLFMYTDCRAYRLLLLLGSTIVSQVNTHECLEFTG